MLKISLLVGIGGFVGANFRYWASFLIAQRMGSAFPLGTLVVNVVGCFILGFVTAYGTETAKLSPEVRLFVGTGMIGALTTFSTFSVETLKLFEDASYGPAVLNVAANLIVGLLAAWLGMVVARGMSA